MEDRKINKPADTSRIGQAETLMTAFAERTGLVSGARPRRYLWTDAFAVCNFLGLAGETDNRQYNELARHLINQVHQILGRHREDDSRTGWLSGLNEAEGAEHPTRGGLRIGKSLPERRPDEIPDEILEWDRDGQYFHYLTKWMHALDVTARHSGDDRFTIWAVELAKAAGKAFIYQPPSGSPRMYWKMSIDLSRPLVPSMGLHDPLDGYITLLQLQATARRFEGSEIELDLSAELDSFTRMIRGQNWVTADPLGIGGLLTDASRLFQLIQAGAVQEYDLLAELLRSAETGLRHWQRTNPLDWPARQRLAFRELGLAIGLQAVQWMRQAPALKGEVPPAGSDIPLMLDALSGYLHLSEDVVSFWLDPSNQSSPTWQEHEDINAVMLATALAPAGFLILPQRD